MAVVNCYKVHYHFERSGKKVSEDYTNYVQAADNSFSSISSVLSSNSLIRGGNTLVIDSVQNVGPSSDTTANAGYKA